LIASLLKHKNIVVYCYPLKADLLKAYA